jgi:hypothetical protein
MVSWRVVEEGVACFFLVSWWLSIEEDDGGVLIDWCDWFLSCDNDWSRLIGYRVFCIVFFYRKVCELRECGICEYCFLFFFYFLISPIISPKFCPPFFLFV